jgi:hypothetical protein
MIKAERCLVDGCPKMGARRTLYMCEPHYRRDAASRAPECWVSLCRKPSRTKQMCQSHYVQYWRTHGGGK